ncbi:hypothetical protein ACFYRL_34045 [Streptomyces goshikiensis]|uniref:hypothetical protein n=1 Tax=Streptomyces goshikiensis TaxID=1942 RepID=UPI0036A36EAD
MSGFEIALVILASGYVAGGPYDRFKKAVTERRNAKARALSGPEPLCGCGHHLAYHDARDALCYASVPAVDAGADEAARRCPCRRYSGPEPLATLYAPELAAPVGERPAIEPAD